MSDHIEPNLDAYLAGGLSANERHDLEQHCAACSACAQQLMEGKQVDQLMDNLFAQTRPDAGLEDRTLERLRRKPAQRYGIMYFVFSAAAVIALGIIGAAAQAMVEGSFGGKRIAMKNNDVEGNLALVIDHSSSMGVEDNERALLSKIGAGVNERFSIIDGDPAATQFNTDIQYLNQRMADVSVPGANNPNEAVGIIDGKKLPDRLPVHIEPIPALGITVIRDKQKEAAAKGDEKESRESVKVVSIKDIDPKVVADAIAAIQGKPTANVGGSGFSGLGWGTGFGGGGFSGFSQDGLAKRGFRDVDGSAANTTGIFSSSETAFGYYGNGITKPLPPPASIVGAGAPPDPTPMPPPTANYYFPGLPKLGASPSPNKAGFFAPAKNDPMKMTPAGDSTPVTPKTNARILPKKLPPSEPDPGTDPQNVQKQPDPQPMPDANRKIIRTGEMEFEIDSFYASVDTINGLLKKVTKGAGFVATSNSDKLPNGKMKGSVVVRMPPQHLDDFLAELRAALGKVGELKSQRIGSADVTKQYTDIESELRAARAVETRLIEIIKTGKGEIKDLIAAERELGTWRTKIEKMEGEIRYYNNQVALSTLTITLAEKEILAAVAMVLRERVAMNVEVEEVEKAQESIAAGVKAAKGRIVKNDLNVGDAGQVSAIVHVEVPPESAPLFRELLKKLGVVSKYQADRTQQAVGGSAEKSLELKQRTDDVRFELNLYNSANIKPRETLHFKVGVADVAETYRTLREAVAKMKGQIRKSDLNEKDPMNITAELVFNVAAPDRAAIDKLVAASGLIVSKHTVQAAINETATERSVGYELALRNIAAIPPRDIFTIAVAAQDVAGSYRKLHDAVVQMKGRIHKGQLNEVDRFNVSAEFDFDAAAADKPALDKLISDIGVTIARKNEQFPAKDESTDQKVGYRLTLKNASGMTPREKAMLAMRVNDVDARAAQLKELVIASKGRVMFSKSERNKNGEMKMVLIFELPHASLDTIVRQIKDGQTPLVYDKELNPQVPDNDLATAQIALTLIAVPDIVPSADEGPLAALHKGLSVAVTILIWCVVFLISGLAIIVPWLIPIWIVVWLVRRRNAAKTVVVEAPKVG